ncbi:hypothetical protein FRIGORI9N_180034 [Frigoribacterium sp. 9N]|nr:hypothetical protein FRIGORI9N_180034 [Frigoribacterium sp. 9N]
MRGGHRLQRQGQRVFPRPGLDDTVRRLVLGSLGVVVGDVVVVTPGPDPVHAPPADDAHQPALDLRGVLDRGQLLPRRDEGLLDDVVDVVGTTEDPPRVGTHQRPVPTNQDLERPDVTVPGTLDEGVVVGVREVDTARLIGHPSVLPGPRLPVPAEKRP